MRKGSVKTSLSAESDAYVTPSARNGDVCADGKARKEEEFFDGFSGLCVKDGEFSVRETKKEDGGFYAKLFYDDALNKFWGYDYKTDGYFKGKQLSEDTAFCFMRKVLQKSYVTR